MRLLCQTTSRLLSLYDDQKRSSFHKCSSLGNPYHFDNINYLNLFHRIVCSWALGLVVQSLVHPPENLVHKASTRTLHSVMLHDSLKSTRRIAWDGKYKGPIPKFPPIPLSPFPRPCHPRRNSTILFSHC